MPIIHYQGVDLFYCTGSKSDAPAMLLLHGGLGSAQDFAAILPKLQRCFFVIEADTRGHGRSMRGTAVPTYAQIADNARHIVQVLGLDEYHVFGFSDGGIAAYRLAARDERVQSVITIGASWHSRQLEPVCKMFENLTPVFFRGDMARQVAVYEALNPQPDLDTLTADLRRMWLDISASGYPNERIAAVKAPVLAVCGERGGLFSPSDLADLHSYLPEAHLMNIPFARHEVIKEQPEILWAAVEAFYVLQPRGRLKNGGLIFFRQPDARNRLGKRDLAYGGESR